MIYVEDIKVDLFNSAELVIPSMQSKAQQVKMTLLFVLFLQLCCRFKKGHTP